MSNTLASKSSAATVAAAIRSSLEPYEDLFDRLWSQGWRNGTELWRQLRRAGFSGALRVVTEWANRRRLDDKRLRGRPDAKP